MAALSLRGIDDELRKALKREAGRRNLSMNRFILETLRKELGLGEDTSGRRRTHHDLDHLAGTWNSSEVADFTERTSEFDQIDEALWRASGS